MKYHHWKAASPTPTHAEAVALGAFKGTQEQWEQMSPGFRREIVRTFKRLAERVTA